MISIVILNWNTSDMLIRLLKSIEENTVNHYNIVIVDNGSRQEEFDKIKNINGKTFIIRNQNNVGFAAGNNQAIKYIKQIYRSYTFFINSDIIVQEKAWDQKHIDLFNKDEKIGIIGCAYHPLKWDIKGNFYVQQLINEFVESESVQGAFFGVKGKVIQELIEKDGCFFDENFKYAQYEETDVCFRTRKMGYKIMWMNCKHLHDHHNSSTKKNGYHLNDEIKDINDFKRNAERNKQLLIQKHKDILI